MDKLRSMLLAVFGPRRMSWRRVAAFVVATGLLWFGRLEPWSWVAVAVIFIGGDAAERVAEVISKRGGVPLPSPVDGEGDK